MFGVVVLFVRSVRMPILMEMFVRVMEMNVSLSDELAEEVIHTEEKKGPSRDAGKPGAHAITDYCAKQGNGQAESSCNQDMAGPSERGDSDGFGRVPFLHARRQDERQPMRGNRRMEEGDGKTGERKGGKDSLIHDAVGNQLGPHGN